jgi:hypothetical protein
MIVQPSSAKAATKKTSVIFRWGPLFFFIGLLCILFYRSFLPDYILFSNDGPLGADMQTAVAVPSGFSGVWMNLNFLGNYAGSVSVDITGVLHWILAPLYFAKFYVPIVIFIVGAGAWFFFKQLKFSPLAVNLGALAAALNSTFFSDAAWGVGTHEIALAMDFCALALVVSNSGEPSALLRWLRLVVAGFAVGMNVTEGGDIGAIYSVFVAAFVFFNALNEKGVPVVKKIALGVGRVAVVAVFAGFLAMQTIIGLIGSEITGISGTGQDAETKAANWDKATQWSLPKKETLGIFVPGLFGYRMNTPKGGNYWGGIGRDPAIDRYFDGGRQGAQPGGTMRFSGGGSYAGILVGLLAAWAIALSFRREKSIFTGTEKRVVWFWAVVMVGSLLMSWGRFEPIFYRLFYALPYASTIRNPCKFTLVFSWAVVILFGYGVQSLSRRYLEVPAGNAGSFSMRLKSWWANIRGFDRNWTMACGIAVIGSVFGWLIYASQKPDLVRYLQMVGFPDEDMAKDIAAFSIGQVGWFILFFALATALFILALAGIFAGKRARLGGILIGALLVVDMGRANLPWIVHWDYVQKYDIDSANPTNSTNPIINFLRDKPYEHRVAILPFNPPQPQLGLFNELYQIEWSQHHFLYYNIQSLDKIQMPRMPADLEAFESALAFGNTLDTTYLIARRWQLTNTRYLLGPAGYLETLNEQLDPAQHSFRIVQRFGVTLKPGVEEFHQRLEELTAVPNDNGDYALFEFTSALPRAKLYSNWQVSTNDPAIIQSWVKTVQKRVPQEMGDALAQLGTNDLATLYTLADKNFDPQQTVLVSKPMPTTPDATNQNPGTVEFKSYAPKDIVFDAKADSPSVLLLNDKFDPHWSVRVDGKPAELLRCNFIMRGVYLTPGDHTVEFRFILPNGPLYTSLAAIGAGIFLIALLIFLGRKPQLPKKKITTASTFTPLRMLS